MSCNRFCHNLIDVVDSFLDTRFLLIGYVAEASAPNKKLARHRAANSLLLQIVADTKQKDFKNLKEVLEGWDSKIYAE